MHSYSVGCSGLSDALILSRVIRLVRSIHSQQGVQACQIISYSVGCPGMSDPLIFSSVSILVRSTHTQMGTQAYQINSHSVEQSGLSDHLLLSRVSRLIRSSHTQLGIQACQIDSKSVRCPYNQGCTKCGSVVVGLAAKHRSGSQFMAANLQQGCRPGLPIPKTEAILMERGSHSIIISH